MLLKGLEVLIAFTLTGHPSHMGVLLASTFGHMHVDLIPIIQPMHALVILLPPAFHLLTLEIITTVRRDQTQMIPCGMDSGVMV